MRDFSYRSFSHRYLLLCCAMSGWIGYNTAFADESGAAEKNSFANASYDTETIYVIGPRAPIGEVATEQISTTITRKDMQDFNKTNVGDALNILPGVTTSTNSRNEKTVSVRGYDSRQVPIFLDGVPVYVPYDGYVDFNRFTTADLAAIQTAKGYSSVAYGPNAMSGAINLISRKPIKKMDGEVTVGTASGHEQSASAALGTNQGLWYGQIGGSYVKSDGFPLPSDFKATATEDGGMRDNSYSKDHKVSLKLGLTPKAGDEYVINYSKQHGEKGQPPSIDPATARFWKWPFWDKESTYFISKTSLSDFEVLKLRLYEDLYNNEVNSYTDNTYSTLKTSGSGSVSTGRSIYNDRIGGGSLDVTTHRIDGQAFHLVAHYREDRHEEFDGLDNRNTHFKDSLTSFGLEDSIQITPSTMFSLGASRHELKPEKVFSVGNNYSLPDKKNAVDAQAGVFYNVNETTRLYTTVAKKSRLPTLKDRYSQRLGTFIENPGLSPESAMNYEVGCQASPWKSGGVEAAVFHSKIDDKIQAVANVSGKQSQMQNIGKTQVSGLELSVKDQLTSWLETGGNYTLTSVKNISSPSTRITDIPRHKVIAHARFEVMPSLDVMVSGEHNSSRWASNTVELHEFSVFNLKLSHHPTDQIGLEAGVTNLTDKNYELADGFPNPGRMLFANARYQF